MKSRFAALLISVLSLASFPARASDPTPSPPPAAANLDRTSVDFANLLGQYAAHTPEWKDFSSRIRMIQAVKHTPTADRLVYSFEVVGLAGNDHLICGTATIRLHSVRGECMTLWGPSPCAEYKVDAPDLSGLHHKGGCP